MKKRNKTYWEKGEKRLVATTCPICGDTIYAGTYKGDSIHCRNCGKTFQPEEQGKLVRTVYHCYACGKGMTLWSNIGLGVIRCVNCGAPIDVLLDPTSKEPVKRDLSTIGRKR